MVSSKIFTWVKAERKLVAELSDLVGRHAFERAYPDACDEGIRVISEKTGNEVMFVENRHVRDAEGELQYVELVPTRDSIRKHPECKGVTMVLFND